MTFIKILSSFSLCVSCWVPSRRCSQQQLPQRHVEADLGCGDAECGGAFATEGTAISQSRRRQRMGSGRIGFPGLKKWGWLDLDFLIRVGGNLARLAGIKVRFIFGKMPIISEISN